MQGWWLASFSGTGIALFLLWSNRARVLAWPETMLIALGLIVSAGPMIKSFHVGRSGAWLETREAQVAAQAAAEVAKGVSDIAGKNETRIAGIEKSLVELSNSVNALKPIVTDAAARTKLDAATKALAEQAILSKAAQDTTRVIQGDVDKVLQAHRKLFKF